MSSIALACAWRPRGDLGRWLRLRPLLEAQYAAIAVALPPDADVEQARALRDGLGATVTTAPRRFTARPASLRAALAAASPAVTHLHYADGDRLLRWVETRPAEWRAALEAVTRTDCLIIGRTAAALETHPSALRDTERIINAVASHLLGMPVDLGGGSRGLSRPAAAAVLRETIEEHWGDAEWPIVLRRLGFRVGHLQVDGLDWETADRGRDRPADAAEQRAAADAYDARAESWRARVRTAAEIVEEALAASRGPVVEHALPSS